MTPIEVLICIFLSCSLIITVIYAYAKPEKEATDEIYDERLHGDNNNDEMLFMQ